MAGGGARSAAPAPSGAFWLALAGLVLGVGGAFVLALHARSLAGAGASAAGPGPAQSGWVRSADALQAALPGVAFTVPERAGVSLTGATGGALLVASGMHGEAPVRVNLCTQMLDPERGRLLPLRVGYRFDDVTRWVERNGVAPGTVGVRNVALALEVMPKLQISGTAAADFGEPDGQALQLEWDNQGAARWISDAGAGRIEQGAHARVALRQDGWLLWGDAAALHIERRASAACPQAGELVLRLLRAGPGFDARALVGAFPTQGRVQYATLPAGRYLTGQARAPVLEDQALFEELQARALVRVGEGGTLALVPRDLAAWRASAAGARAGELDQWKDTVIDAAAAKLIKRLYLMPDGQYVRQQIHIYNSERRLFAWRSKELPPAALWQAASAGAPLAAVPSMPSGAAAWFATLPQGWSPWRRVAQWPRQDAAPLVRLTLSLARPAAGGEQVQVMLAGRVLQIEGARLRDGARAACSGRACPSADTVQELTLALKPGVRELVLVARPLETGALGGAGDERYRHLRLVDGRVKWHALVPAALQAGAVPAPERAGVTLVDRNGTPLWSGGAPTAQAAAAGLAPLLGVRAEHASSVAGMLARLPSASAVPHAARLSIDLALQAASQGALDCIGMRHGRWSAGQCSGAQAIPEGRRAGVVVLDTETGDVLAAAGAGAGSVDASNWSEVRAFDQANPARSPLRLPALQHDGGAHQSPGSTFKVISALGLELAARSDRQLDAMLDGMPLAALNALARRRGYAFETGAAAYPNGTRLAHITNYKGELLDRRAQDGRLGLSQALTFSLNTWFAWCGEVSDRTLFGRPDGGAPDVQALEAGALDGVRPILAMAHRLGFEQALRLDGGLLPADFRWAEWDALQASAAHIDPVHSRHELRQMAIGLRMQVTPLQMALAAAAVGQGKVVAPRLLLSLDGRDSAMAPMAPLGVRLERIRAGMKGVVDVGTAAGAFGGARLGPIRRGLSGKTGTAPSTVSAADGGRADAATVWFTGWLEPGSVPGQAHRLAIAAFVSHSQGTGGEHAAPIAAAVLASLLPLP
ncbi:MAG: penicillin-binding transpeptidase domain-containing protein [Pseudomonadota bacterium]